MMIELTDIPEAEFNHYFRSLIPRLLRERPRRWTKIADIANDPERFVGIIECLATYGYFDNNSGYCMIELSDDSLYVRIDPNAILFRANKEFRWKYEGYIHKQHNSI